MKNHLLLLVGAAALASAAPAFAKPGKGQGNAHANHHAHGVNGPVGYGAGGCPPGLAKKSPACIPPGQAKKLGIGQRFPYASQSLFGYNQLPYDMRSRYGYDPYARYGYDNGSYYQVDPATMIVRQVLGSILR